MIYSPMDTGEKNAPNFYSNVNRKDSTIIVDNGTFEFKAGFHSELSMIVKNKIYKYKDKVSFEPFPSSSLKTMHDSDVVINLDVLECTLDGILSYLAPDKLDNLILTNTPESPTEAEVLGFLFETYSFQKIQLGYDFIYCYHKYFNEENCVILNFGYSSVIVCVVFSGKITSIYKINFGGRALVEYINYIMIDKYKETRKDYRGLINQIRVAENYNKESIDIYYEMCNGIYDRNVFLSEKPGGIVEKESVKKIKKEKNSKDFVVPFIDYCILNADEENSDKDILKEKRKLKMVYFGALSRIKTKIEKKLNFLEVIIEGIRDEVEKVKNLSKYIQNKKKKFEMLKRDLELREKTRRDSKNKKTREFQVKIKEANLTEEELEIKNRILDADDNVKENSLIEQMNKLAADIVALDPEFIPFYANSVEILRGDNIGRQCVNIDLIKWPEIFFDPSIIGLEDMGLTEIIEDIFRLHQIDNVLICGGFSFIKNLDKRVFNEISQYKLNGIVNLKIAHDSQKDPFYGSMLSPLFPIYTRKEFEKLGSFEMINKYRRTV